MAQGPSRRRSSAHGSAGGSWAALPWAAQVGAPVVCCDVFSSGVTEEEPPRPWRRRVDLRLVCEGGEPVWPDGVGFCPCVLSSHGPTAWIGFSDFLPTFHYLCQWGHMPQGPQSSQMLFFPLQSTFPLPSGPSLSCFPAFPNLVSFSLDPNRNIQQLSSLVCCRPPSLGCLVLLLRFPLLFSCRPCRSAVLRPAGFFSFCWI